jgi:hypothetical protein
MREHVFVKPLCQRLKGSRQERTGRMSARLHHV